MELNGRTFVTSDTHFGEDAIRRRFGRDFDDIETMDQCLIDGINEVVRPDDVLLHLGDFIGNLADSRVRTAESVRDRIACRRIILVRGNHDPAGKPRFTDLFDSVHDLLSFKLPAPEPDVPRVRLVLSHYPLRVWQGRHDGSLHLYGHAHGTVEELGRSTDVGVDSWGFRPQPLDSIVSMLCQRPIDFDRIRPRAQPDRSAGT